MPVPIMMPTTMAVASQPPNTRSNCGGAGAATVVAGPFSREFMGKIEPKSEQTDNFPAPGRLSNYDAIYSLGDAHLRSPSGLRGSETHIGNATGHATQWSPRASHFFRSCFSSFCERASNSLTWRRSSSAEVTALWIRLRAAPPHAPEFGSRLVSSMPVIARNSPVMSR